MQTLLQPCKSLSILKYSSSSSPSPLPSLHNFTLICNDAIHNKAYLNKCPLQKRDHFHAYATVIYPKLVYAKRFRFWRSTPLVFCSQNDVFDDFSSTQLPKKLENDRNQDAEELELLSKPSPVPINNGSALKVDEESQKPDEDEVLAPFLRFFKPRNSFEEVEEEGSGLEVNKENNGDSKKEESKKVSVECYEPKPGDCVVGVVVSGNENKLDVNVGADFLGTMLTKEVLPLYDKEMEYLLCDLKRDAEEFMVQGKMGIVKDDNALSGGPAPGAPVVETGTVLFAEVLGRTLSGRPLLSSRRLFRQMSWHRVRQIKELDEPIEVKMTEWNTGGLLTRIEGLRAFLPKVELMKRVNTFTELKENVGRRMYVVFVSEGHQTSEEIKIKLNMVRSLCVSVSKNYLSTARTSNRLLSLRTQSNQPPKSDRSDLSDSDHLLRKLEDAIHRIIVRRSAPDWLPFLPGSSYWVPPPRSHAYGLAQLVEKFSSPLTKEQSMSITTDTGWPSSDYFIKGEPPHQVEVETSSYNDSQDEDEEG